VLACVGLVSECGVDRVQSDDDQPSLLRVGNGVGENSRRELRSRGRLYARRNLFEHGDLLFLAVLANAKSVLLQASNMLTRLVMHADRDENQFGLGLKDRSVRRGFLLSSKQWREY
jgi:hypothetical protein